MNMNNKIVKIFLEYKLKKVLLIKTTFLFLFVSSILFGQETNSKKYWIFFKDKGPNVSEKMILSKDADLYRVARASLSDRAIQRRAKVLPAEKLIDFTDLPVNNNYTVQIETFGIKIENRLKWFNAITAYLTESEKQKIYGLDFVKEIRPVASFKNEEFKDDFNIFKTDQLRVLKTDHKLRYGNSLSQVEMINVPIVHDIDINGADVIVGMLDSGFKWKTHRALSSRQIVKEYDFVLKVNTTDNEPAGYSGYGHGTGTFSVLGGYLPDSLIGPAFNSKFLLAKTEDIRSETRVEEDNWAAGIEWMEGYGVDVASSSLGYNEFNNSIGNYTYKDMDGKTAICTKAADLAVSKGVVVVNSAGNEGSNSWKYITAPADGINVIAVGAVTNTGGKASYSSIGPTYDGRTKPDVSALGSGVWWAVIDTKNTISTANGTSLSCPLVGGVAALILSARPELTPSQVRDALRNTASQVSSPDNLLGWGIIDAYRAVTYHGLVFSNLPEIKSNNGKFDISIFVASRYNIQQQTVKINYTFNNSENYTSLAMSPDSIIDNTNSGRYKVSIPSGGSENIYYYFSATDNSGQRNHPYTPASNPQKTFSVSITTIPRVPTPEKFRLSQNYPNPFNPNTNITVEIPQTTTADLSIFNCLGQKIRTLFSGILASNFYNFTWDGKNSQGNNMPSGIYYYKISTDKFTEIKKMVFSK
jgi:serine protease AprX